MSRTTIIAVLIILNGCGPSATRLEDHKPLAQSLQAAKTFEVYEGLPHQNFEPQLLRDELASKKTITFGKFPFYAAPLELNEADGTTLLDLFCKIDSFVPLELTAAKACGGFHPDYCLTWKVGTKTYYALLCFGCREVKAAGNDLELHAELHEDFRQTFMQVLDSYQKNRPARQL